MGGFKRGSSKMALPTSETVVVLLYSTVQYSKVAFWPPPLQPATLVNSNTFIHYYAEVVNVNNFHYIAAVSESLL